jgi:hypothetical protein
VAARLRVLISRPGPGRSVLRCIRADGSDTWQKQEKHAEFFVAHDLTHFAVESILGLASGFFGLLAAGWSIEDTTGKGARGALPAEAHAAEVLVGLLDSERASGTLWTAEEFNEALRLKLGDEALTLSGDQLLAIRRRRAELQRRWAETAEGATMELQFPQE